jgi:TrmH family RNA methyltransferase
MHSMTDSQTPQGILALASTNSLNLKQLWEKKPQRLAFFWQMQDPGNAGTVIRTADACGFDAVIFSSKSVDIFNPKTVRATVGSLWHIPVLHEVDIQEFLMDSSTRGFQIYALSGSGTKLFNRAFVESIAQEPKIWIFGNEARGLPELAGNIVTVSIPMSGHAESLNVASAAAIVLHSVGIA